MSDLKKLIADMSPEADAYIGVSRKTRANWRVQGIGPRHVRVGGRIFYHPDDISDWVNARRVSSTSEPVAA